MIGGIAYDYKFSVHANEKTDDTPEQDVWKGRDDMVKFILAASCLLLFAAVSVLYLISKDRLKRLEYLMLAVLLAVLAAALG